MDDNPYKSPETEGAPVVSGFGPFFRSLAQVALAACAAPFLMLAMLLIVSAFGEKDASLLLFALGYGAVGAAFLYGATKMRRKPAADS